jgi:hypothetical protein
MYNVQCTMCIAFRVFKVVVCALALQFYKLYCIMKHSTLV